MEKLLKGSFFCLTSPLFILSTSSVRLLFPLLRLEEKGKEIEFYLRRRYFGTCQTFWSTTSTKQYIQSVWRQVFKSIEDINFRLSFLYGG